MQFSGNILHIANRSGPHLTPLKPNETIPKLKKSKKACREPVKNKKRVENFTSKCILSYFRPCQGDLTFSTLFLPGSLMPNKITMIHQGFVLMFECCNVVVLCSCTTTSVWSAVSRCPAWCTGRACWRRRALSSPPSVWTLPT